MTMENTKAQIIDILRTQNTFAIVPHINPDADAMGSCYAVQHVLERMGKKAVVFVEEELPRYLSFLHGNCSVFTQAEPYDVCLCIDCGDLGRTGARGALLDMAKIGVNIDHHYANTNYAAVNLVDASASSSGEICYGLLSELGEPITPAVGACLYSAICADTGGFKYSNTTSKTMRIAADLLELGIDLAGISKRLFDTESYASFQLKGEIINNIRLYCNGLVGTASVTMAMMARYGVNSKDIDNIVDLARKVDGVEVAVSFKECEKGIKISLRSNEFIDVSKIAEKFGGGGHVRAAGLLMETDLETAQSQLLDEIITTVGEQMR